MNKECRLSMKFIWMILIIFTAFSCFAQPERIDRKFMDSILPMLNEMPADTVKVNNLNRLSSMMIFSNSDSSILFVEQADSLATVLNYHRGRIFCLGNLAWIYAIMGEKAKAIYMAKKAMPIAEKYYPEALIYVYNILFFANAYGINGDLEKAMVWGQKSLQSPNFKALPDSLKWPTYLQLGLGYSGLKQIDSAKYYANKLLSMIDRVSANNPLAHDTYMLWGNLEFVEKNFPLALKYYTLSPYELGIALVYQALGKRDSVIKYANIHLQLGEQAKNPNIIMEGSKLLATEYAEIDIKESNRYLQKYVAASDSLNSAEKQKQIEQLRFTEQVNEFELQTRDAANRNRIIQILFISILAFLSGLSYLLWRNNKFKQKVNLKLETSYADLKAAQAQLIQSEKMASLGELTAGIAHEIQNPLNFVNNFSEVNAELSDEMLEAANKGDLSAIKVLAVDIKSNQEKISEHGKRADAIVKGMLQHSRASSGEKQATDINALADEYLRLAYQGFRAKDKNFNVKLINDFDPAVGKIEIVSPDIGRVLLNLFNNAFYAVNEKNKEGIIGYEPEVKVSISLVTPFENSLIHQSPPVGGRSTNSLIIAVVDNGNGISQKLLDKIFQPFFTTKPSGQGTGLGLSLSYDIVKAHGGEMTVDTKEGEGAVFIIKLPKV